MSADEETEGSMSCCTTKVVTIRTELRLGLAMNHFILYGTLGCHLCEQAEILLTPLLSSDCTIECVDIGDSDALLERYSTTIPVLRRLSDNAELPWPFDIARVREFLSGH